MPIMTLMHKSLPWLLVLSLALIGCTAHRLTGAEETAVRFYKTLWVEANEKEAGQMMFDHNRTREISAVAEDVRSVPNDNKPILVTKSPTESQVRFQTVLIHRPSDKKDFKIQLRHTGREWKVIRFQRNYDPHRGGYNSFETYQRLSREYPELRWKRISQP